MAENQSGSAKNAAIILAQMWATVVGICIGSRVTGNFAADLAGRLAFDPDTANSSPWDNVGIITLAGLIGLVIGGIVSGVFTVWTIRRFGNRVTVCALLIGVLFLAAPRPGAIVAVLLAVVAIWETICWLSRKHGTPPVSRLASQSDTTPGSN